MSYESAAEARQHILDYLNAQPTGYAPSGPEIMSATGLIKNVWQGCVKTMCQHLEMEKIGKGKAVRYRAKVKTTISGEDLKVKADAARKITAQENVKQAKYSPGRYEHIPGHYPAVDGHIQGQPLKNQEGIGSGRRTVYVGSTAWMV